MVRCGGTVRVPLFVVIQLEEQHHDTQHATRNTLAAYLSFRKGLETLRLAALFAFFGYSLWMPTVTRAATNLPGVVVDALRPSCAPGDAEIWIGDSFAGCVDLQLVADQISPFGWSWRPFGGGGGAPIQPIPNEAEGSCDDAGADAAAGVAFRAYWSTHINKGRVRDLFPNNHVYRIPFSDGTRSTYRWTQPPQSSIPVTLISPCV